jgi:hypothetical protein
MVAAIGWRYAAAAVTERKAPPDVVNDFDAWARVSVRLLGKTDDERDELLCALGIDKVWGNADSAWAKALAEEILEARLDRLRRYAAACATAIAITRRTNVDFRHEALFGAGLPPDPNRPRPIGGTPFSSDPDDRIETRKMVARDVRDALARTRERGNDAPKDEGDGE